MASQILSGSGNVSYTNNTGQIVRVIINSINCGGEVGEISISWGSSNNLASVTAKYVRMLGKNLAHSGSSRKLSTIPGLSPINYIISTDCDGMIIDPYTISNNGPNSPIQSGSSKPTEQNYSLPTEIYLNPLDIVSILGRSYIPPTSSSSSTDLSTTSTSPIRGYNIIIIPENG